MAKLNDRAILPTRAYDDDAGLDIYATDDVVLSPGERHAVHTGIVCIIPTGYTGLIWDKSGRALRDGIKTLGGVIDAGYRGEIRIGLVNLSNRAVHIRGGEKVAQLLVQKIELVRPVEVTEIGDSDRGARGFGSSGI